MTQEEILDAALGFIRAANRSDAEKLVETFSKVIISEHRTNQQIVMGVLARIIDEYAKQQGPGYVDPRNQHSKEWAKKVAAVTDEVAPTGRFAYL